MKIVKCTILSILLFVVATIWCHIIAMTTLLNDPSRNVLFDFVIIALPFIIIPILFIREKKFLDSIKFGAIIGFISGMFFLIYWMVLPIITAPDPNADYSFLPVILAIFTMFFIGSSVVGSMLSYLIRKSIKKFKTDDLAKV